MIKKRKASAGDKRMSVWRMPTGPFNLNDTIEAINRFFENNRKKGESNHHRFPCEAAV